MRVEDVVDMINYDFTYKPGWRVWAYNYPGDDVVRVKWEVTVPNSTPPSVDGRREVLADDSFDLHVEGKSELEIQSETLFNLIVGKGEIHEAREFARFNGHAPFHPHRGDGQEAFDRFIEMPKLKVT